MDRDTIPTKPDDLFDLLDDLGIAYDLHHHAPIFTVEEGLPLKKAISGLHCRNLFLRDKKKTMVLVTAANETPIDLKTLADALGCKKFSFASSDRLEEYLGIYPGAVTPFSVINDKQNTVRMVLDRSMLDAPVINVHPLDNAMTVSVSPSDLLKFFAHTGHTPHIIDFQALPTNPS